MKTFPLLVFICAVAAPLAFAASAPTIPQRALAVTQIQKLTNWQDTFDTATGTGTASGLMGLVGWPSLSGSSREFATTFTNYGGERYWTTFGADTSSENFVYDAWVYLANPSSGIANIEMDMNQVMSNGETVIFGFQCDGYAGKWDYTKNSGTPLVYIDQWVSSKATCNPRQWTTKTWHHIQIQFSRDAFGNVTYDAVWFDGTKQAINATVPSAFALGWGSVLLTNFQVDGLGAGGTDTVYLDKLTVYRW